MEDKKRTTESKTRWHVYIQKLRKLFLVMLLGGIVLALLTPALSDSIYPIMLFGGSTGLTLFGGFVILTIASLIFYIITTACAFIIKKQLKEVTLNVVRKQKTYTKTEKRIAIAIAIIVSVIWVSIIELKTAPCATQDNQNCIWSTEEAIIASIPNGASIAEIVILVEGLFETLKKKAMKNCENYCSFATFGNDMPGTKFSYMKKDGEIIWVEGGLTKENFEYHFVPLENTDLGKLWKKENFKQHTKVYVNYKCGP